MAAVASVRAARRPAARTILVVDHNPGLLERARAAFPDVLVVPNEGPVGLSGGRNTGISHAVGDVVAFLDDDARAEPDWLERLAAGYSDPSILGVGGPRRRSGRGGGPAGSRPSSTGSSAAATSACQRWRRPSGTSSAPTCRSAGRCSTRLAASPTASDGWGRVPSAARRPSWASGCGSGAPTAGSSTSRPRSSTTGSPRTGRPGATSAPAASPRASPRPWCPGGSGPGTRSRPNAATCGRCCRAIVRGLDPRQWHRSAGVAGAGAIIAGLLLAGAGYARGLLASSRRAEEGGHDARPGAALPRGDRAPSARAGTLHPWHRTTSPTTCVSSATPGGSASLSPSSRPASGTARCFPSCRSW